MSKKRQQEEFVESLQSLIISYNVEIEKAEDRFDFLRKERDAIRKRLSEEV